MQSQIKTFPKLDTAELYGILALRSRIFVCEQNCAYLDPDGEKDFDAHHFFIRDGDTLAAYARIIPPRNGKYPTIGRVAVAPEYREQGLGRRVMEETMEYCLGHWPDGIYLQAQDYLIDFYRTLGFTVMSESHLEDGIPHTDMLFTPSSDS